MYLYKNTTQKLKIKGLNIKSRSMEVYLVKYAPRYMEA